MNERAQVAAGSGAMFDRIAGRYDLLNRLMSGGLDRGWRRKLVRALGLAGDAPARVLDVATGTADVALAVAEAHPGARVTGLDPSPGMLAEGAVKVRESDVGDRVELVLGDAQALPFADAAFDAVAISFGIRNVPDRARGLAEMVRVTRPGGRVAVLELGEPEGPFARFHVHHVVPRLGAWLSGAREYRYLQSSIAAFPPAAEFADMMRRAGLEDVAVERLALGAAHLYSGLRAG